MNYLGEDLRDDYNLRKALHQPAFERTNIMIVSFALILMASLLGNYTSVSSQNLRFGMPNFHIASADLSGNVTDAAVSVAYDEQIGMTFTQSFTSLSYNVTAVAQQDAYGYGPAYLLNGVTNVGYWYQIGLSWNWPQLSGGSDAGFHANYNVFNNGGTVVLPTNGSGGTINLSGVVNQGDSVDLSLSFSNGNVLMNVYDWNTGASAQVTYNSEGATQFVGSSTASNSNGFFTGLMTEQYHVSPYTGSEQKVTYGDTIFALSSGILWIDEYNVNTLKTQFQGSSAIISFSSNPTKLQSYSLDGATESANANNFITGSINSVQLTLSFSIVGSGTSFTPPTLSYMSDGFQQTANLTTSPIVYSLDSGTLWSISDELVGSTSTERWITNQTISRNALSATTINFVYYHQYPVTFAYSVVGGGIGYTAPTTTVVQFGSKISALSGQKTWADAGSQYSFTNPLTGSTQAERWQASNSSSTGQISSSTIISAAYYHQFATTAGYTVTNGGVPPTEPILTSELFGTVYSYSLAITPMTNWIDAGSNYNISGVISSSLERWITNSSTTGTVMSPLSLSFKFDHQYYLTIQSNNQAGGNVSPLSEWVNAGNSISIASGASNGWRFEFWTGSGAGSYSGTANSTAISVQAPITENATFYADLTIGVTGDGTVTYAFGNSGTLQVSSQAEVYVPPGTVVTLNANPSSFLYKLDSWIGTTTDSSHQTTVTVDSPSTAEAQFGYNYLSMGAIIAVIIVAIIGIGTVTMRRKSS